jgi:hypothetical protein
VAARISISDALAQLSQASAQGFHNIGLLLQQQIDDAKRYADEQKKRDEEAAKNRGQQTQRETKRETDPSTQIGSELKSTFRSLLSFLPREFQQLFGMMSTAFNAPLTALKVVNSLWQAMFGRASPAAGSPGPVGTTAPSVLPPVGGPTLGLPGGTTGGQFVPIIHAPQALIRAGLVNVHGPSGQPGWSPSRPTTTATTVLDTALADDTTVIRRRRGEPTIYYPPMGTTLGRRAEPTALVTNEAMQRLVQQTTVNANNTVIDMANALARTAAVRAAAGTAGAGAGGAAAGAGAGGAAAGAGAGGAAAGAGAGAAAGAGTEAAGGILSALGSLAAAHPIIAAIVGATAAVLALSVGMLVFPALAQGLTERIREGQRDLARWSAQISFIFAQAEYRQIRRDILIGQGTAASTQMMSTSVESLKDSNTELSMAWRNLKNLFAAGFAKSTEWLTSWMKPIFKEFNDFVNDWLKDQKPGIVPMSTWLRNIGDDAAKMRIDGTAPEDYRWPGR